MLRLNTHILNQDQIIKMRNTELPKRPMPHLGHPAYILSPMNPKCAPLHQICIPFDPIFVSFHGLRFGTGFW